MHAQKKMMTEKCMVLAHLCPTSIIAGGESPYMARITAMTSLVRVCSGDKTLLKTEIVSSSGQQVLKQIW
jgi:hypothetical protein